MTPSGLNCRHGSLKEEGVIFWYRGGLETPQVPKFGVDLGIARARVPGVCRFCKESEGK
jgi:hypothetical protein